MADLEASDVTIVNGWPVNQGSRVVALREFSLVLDTMGTAANAIPASVLGFSKIISAEPGILDTNAGIIVAAPSLDGTKLLLKAAATNAPADYSGTLVIRVLGV